VAELAWFGPDEVPAEMAFPHQDEVLRPWAAGAGVGVPERKNGPNGS
jgi:hypothetical protein